ncbi:MAG TPA: serine/threonine-protein kinase, partial [Rugosimonospora sp.]|nr:serine/threonine-protein kinase [Rugosimonospora sp.]
MRLLGTRYRLAAVLGTGSGSVVWRGYDELLGRQVAVKMLVPAGDEEFPARIRQEAMAAARITHPNIAGVHDYGEAVEADGDRVPYIVLELVEGPSLDQRLTEGPLPWPEAVRIGAQVAAAVLAAHEAGLVHRDINPANVLLAPGGAKVIDFGICATIGEPESAHTQPETPAFIAPERVEPDVLVHPAADVFALGVLLHQTVNGAPTGSGTVPLPPLTPDLPPPVAHLIERCLARRPQDRPSSLEVALALAQAAHTARWAAFTPPELPEPLPEPPSEPVAPAGPGDAGPP